MYAVLQKQKIIYPSERTLLFGVLFLCASAAAKKAALAEAQHTSTVEITEEKIEWLSGKRVSSDNTAPAIQPETASPSAPVLQPEPAPIEEKIDDMSHE